MQIFRQKGQNHRTCSIHESDKSKYPNFSRKPTKVIDIAVKCGFEHKKT